MNDKLKELMYGPDYEIIDIYDDYEKIIIKLQSNKKECSCPKCGQKNKKISGTYKRMIQDIPIRNKETWLEVKVRQYYCCNKNCSTKVFSEEISFAKTNQVKTDSLMQMILAISLYLSNTSCSLILGFLGIKASADTIQNIYNGIEIVDNPDVEKIGIDDVATRKGRKYATAIYDLESHRLIGLLDGRDAQVVKDWLKDHQKITVVARDRASSYASAISEILPNCIQVADRYHLFQNLSEALKKIFYAEVPNKIYIKDDKVINNSFNDLVLKEIRDIDTSVFNYDNSPPLNEQGNIIYFDSKKRTMESTSYEKLEKNRKAKYDKILSIQNKYNKNEKQDYKQIADEFEISVPTARKYLKMTKEQIEQIKKLNNYKKRKTMVDDFINIIYKMLRDGLSHNEIFAYVISKGFNGDYRGLSNYIYFIAKNNFPNLKIKRMIYYNPAYRKDVTVITKKDLFIFILTLDEKKKNKNKQSIIKYLDEIKKEYPIIQDIENYFKEFHSIIMGDDENKIDDFINKNKESHISEFVKNLHKDIQPIKYAISTPISSGFVEGNNNKFKLIKRIVYGKSKLVNLFKKSYLLFWCTKEDFDISMIL